METSGRQVGEKLFNLLNAEQQCELIDFILDVEKLATHTANLPFAFSSRQKVPDSNKTLTEIQVGGLYFCLEEHQVSICGQTINLTAREFAALHLLIENQRRVMTFEIISYHVWGTEYVENELSAIHNLMSRLRRKLQVNPDTPDYIKSIRGVGYKFEPEP